MNSWKVILATLVIFGAGVITGGLLVSYSDRALRPGPPRPLPNPNQPAGAPNNLAPGQNRIPVPMPAPLRKDFLDRLQQELRLTTGQRERIERIITDGQERTRQVWQQIEPRLRRELMEARGQIREVLTPEQQVRFEELMKQRPRDWRPLQPRDRAVEGAPSNRPPGPN